jgi:hypothetical protein
MVPCATWTLCAPAEWSEFISSRHNLNSLSNKLKFQVLHCLENSKNIEKEREGRGIEILMIFVSKSSGRGWEQGLL